MGAGQTSVVTSAAGALETGSPESQGIDAAYLARLYERIESHIEAGWYPGASLAMARRGTLVAAKTFGMARLATAAEPATAADDETMWLLYSQTKPVTSCVVWHLIEQGLLRFHDTVAEYVPAFARHGKEQVTLYHLLSHQAGFPDADVPREAWDDHTLLREAACDFRLAWEPGANVWYHRGAAHWVQAVLIEAVTGQDYRQYIREQVLQPLGLHGLCIGVPGPRTVQYVTRNHTGERVDQRFGIPMHRGLGVHMRGTTSLIRGLGSTASPETFGHGGAGTSYSWADPHTGVSCTYLSNAQLPEPLHSKRMDEIMTLAHAAVVEL